MWVAPVPQDGRGLKQYHTDLEQRVVCSARPTGRARIETGSGCILITHICCSARPTGRARIETLKLGKALDVPPGSARPTGRARIET